MSVNDSSESLDFRRRMARALPNLLSKIGIIDRDRGIKTLDLAWPVIVTGGLRITLRLADFLMVGLAIGSTAVAALGFGFQFYFIGFALALALSSGTISLVSQHYGAGEYDEADFVIKQSVMIAVLFSIPMMILAWFYAEEAIGILGAAPDVVELGGVYLRVLMLGVFPRFFSMIAARGFAGSGDTVTPMYVRAVGLPANIILNWILIFGIGPAPRLGVMGAGIGTTVTNFAIASIFASLLLLKNHNVSLVLGGKQWDMKVVKKLFKVSIPLLGMRMARTGGRFPLLWILASLGTGTVAAYQVGQRVVFFAMMPAWGFSTAASTLVGQSLGADREELAESFGWDILKMALVVMLSVAGLIAVFAGPIAGLFSDDPSVISESTKFIWIYSIGVLGFSIDRISRGSLRGAGDTRWPMYGMIVGIYLWLLPVSYLLGIELGMGVLGIFVGILGGLFIPAFINLLRFRGGSWKAVSREIRSSEER